MKSIALVGSVLLAATASAVSLTENDTTWWSLEDGVLTLTNTDPDLSKSTNTYATVIGADVTKIVKKGPGAVRLDGTNASFAGEIEVQDGLLMGWVQESYSVDKVGMKTPDNFGAPTKVTVSDGATLEMLATPIVNASHSGSRFKDTQFYVQGTGVKGMGALYRKGSLQTAERSYGTIRHLTLNGPTTLYVGMRWGFNGTSTLNQNGHKLTLTSKSKNDGVRTFNFSREGVLTVTNPGDIFLDNVVLCNENYPPKAAGGASLADSTIVITNNAHCQGLATDKSAFGAWTVPYQLVSYGGYLVGPNASKAAYEMTATFSGDLTLASGTTILRAYDSTGRAHLGLTGRVNGPGTLQTFENTSGSDGSKPTSVTLTGGGPGKTSSFGKIVHQSGRLVFAGGSTFAITNGGTVVGATRADRLAARLVVTNATLAMTTAVEKPYSSGYSSPYNLLVGCTAGKCGIVEIGQGAVVTNDMRFGADAKSAGALYLHDDANLYWHGGGGSNPFLGNAGYGFLSIRDNATMGNLGYFNIGSNSGRSYVIQRGGTYHNALCGLKGHTCSFHDMAFKIGRKSGEGHYYQCGGTQWSKGSVCFTWDYATAVADSHGSFTVDGTAESEVRDIQFCVTLAGTPDYNPTMAGTFGHVNVNGGTLTVNRMYKTYQSGFKLNDSTKNATWNDVRDICPNTWAFVNFNGGVLKVKGDGDFFSTKGTAENQRLPTRVTVYEKGAVIDTTVDSIWRLPLEKPYGLGVKSISLTDDIRADNTYIGPGRVVFTGAGSNTTAIVDFDERTRTNCDVIVTSAGYAYKAKPTVKIEKSACDGSSYWTLPAANAEMVDFDAADYVPGGLTKRGTGTLTLAGKNTYGGKTRVEQGTLAFTHASGYPGGDLEFTGETLATGVPKVTAKSISFRAGCGLRIADAELLDLETFGKSKVVLTTDSALTALPGVTFVSTNGTVLATGTSWNSWAVKLTDGGKTVKFGANRGLMLIVR